MAEAALLLRYLVVISTARCRGERQTDSRGRNTNVVNYATARRQGSSAISVILS